MLKLAALYTVWCVFGHVCKSFCVIAQYCFSHLGNTSLCALPVLNDLIYYTALEILYCECRNVSRICLKSCLDPQLQLAPLFSRSQRRSPLCGTVCSPSTMTSSSAAGLLTSRGKVRQRGRVSTQTRMMKILLALTKERAKEESCLG